MLKLTSSKIPNHFVSLLALPGLLLMFCTAAFADNDTTIPEVSKDGLHLMKDTEAAIVYVKPGANLDDYTDVMLADCFVAFQDNWQHEYNLTEVGLEGRISNRDMEVMKKNLAEEFNEVFAAELEKKGHNIVDQPGDGVLMIRPALINVVANAPDPRNRMDRTMVESAGSMTLYMDMYDSSTNDILVRVVDPRGDDDRMAHYANRATNRAAVDRMIRFWAELLAENLGGVKDSSD